MSTRVTEKRIETFFTARLRLPYEDQTVAMKMGIDKTTYSAYINRRHTITNKFLSKFYKAFEAELSSLIPTQQKPPTGISADRNLDNPSLEERITRLEKWVESHETSIDKIRIHLDQLDKKIDTLMDTNERIMNNLEVLLNLKK